MAARNTTGVEFKLLAPYNETVELIGDWNNWQPVPMKKDKHGYWKVRVPLEDGEYQYKFRLKSLSYFMQGEMVDIPDPYATHLSGDQWENSCVVIKKGRPVVTSYKWKHDDKPLPSNDKLVIYELHVGDFSGGPGDGTPGGSRTPGRFVDVLEKLDYLAELGINAIEFMPIKEFPGDQSWGYMLRSLFTIESAYGTPDDFCRLVDECHARGIRVILDMVFNHSDLEAPLTRIDYQYWYYEQNPDPEELHWGPKFDFGRYDEKHDVFPARKYVLDAINYWIEYFHVDGFRFDAARAIRYDFLHEAQQFIYNKINGLKPFITIAEHIPQNPAVVQPHGPLDCAWHENFYRQMACTTVGAPQEGREPYNLDGVIYNALNPGTDGFPGAMSVVNYLNSHDENRILWQIGNSGGYFDDAAFRRNKLGAALLLTAPGIPMLWMGEEFGESAPRTMERQALDWVLLDHDRTADLHRYYRGLIHLRRSLPALQGDTFEVVLRDDQRGLIGFKRWNDAGSVVVVVANLKHEYAGEFTVDALEDGVWHEYIFNYDNHVQGGTLRDTLAESEVKVFIKQ